MSTNYNPKIVKDGLVLCLDAANKKSYPGTGTAWADLSGNGLNGALVNSPTYSSDNLGSISFDGIDDYTSVGSLPGSLSSFTVIVWFYPKSVSNYENVLDCNYSYNGTTGNIGPRLEMDSTGQLAWVYSNITTDGSSFYGHIVLNNGLAVNKWHFTAITYDGNLNSSNCYYNGENTNISRQTFGSVTGFIGTFSNVILGKGYHPGGAERIYTGNISNVVIYNRVLSQEEIAQNFNALRGRYGI